MAAWLFGARARCLARALGARTGFEHAGSDGGAAGGARVRSGRPATTRRALRRPLVRPARALGVSLTGRKARAASCQSHLRARSVAPAPAAAAAAPPA